MDAILKLPAARKVVQKLGGVTPSTKTLVLYDLYTAHNVEPLAIALSEVGCPLHLLQIDGSSVHGRQLSDIAAAAMRAADLVIGLTRANIAHTAARREATASGTGVIVLPESHGADFFLADGWNADFDALRPEIDALAAALAAARTARVTSAAGTDLTLSVEGRRGRALNGFPNTVDIAAGYCLEASIAPVEGTANGVIVVNGSIPGVAVVREAPVRIVMQDGFAVAIEGGREAAQFRDLLRSFDDPLVYNLGELGVGMNPKCTLDGTMLSDESIYGAIHLALGTSAYIGGHTKAAAHYDTVLVDATLELDGRVVVQGGKVFPGA